MKTIFKLKKIYIEFHSQYMNELDKKIYDIRELNILNFLKNNKIDFELWH